MAEIITTEALNESIAALGVCMGEDLPGFTLPALDEPGLGNILLVMIRTFEKGLTTTFEPILWLKEIITEYATDPVQFPIKLAELAVDMAEIFPDPIGWIVEKIVEPVSANITIPLVLPIAGLEIAIDEKYTQLPEEAQAMMDKMLEIPEAMPKIIGFIMMPINVILGFLTAFMGLFAEIITNVTEIVTFLTDWTVNFVDSLLGMIGTIFGEVVSVIGATFFPPGVEVPANLAETVTLLITDIFTGNFLNLDKYKELCPNLSMIEGFIVMIKCFINWVLTFILEFPALFLGI